MAEQPPTDPPEPPAPPTAPPAPPAEPNSANAEAARYRVQRNEARQAAEAAEAARKVAEDAAARANSEAEAARLDALRVRVATKKGLSPDLADRLRGATEEEIEADADTLRAAIPTAGLSGPLRSGTSLDPDGPTLTGAEVVDRIPRSTRF